MAYDRYHSGDTEKLDDTPIEMPMGACRPKSLHEIVAAMVRQQVEEEKGQQVESFEEADDFEAEDEDELLLDMSPYTLKEVKEEYAVADSPGRSETEPKPNPEVKFSVAELRQMLTEAEQTGDSPDPNDPEPDKT